jgi:polar amino acid transport system ATP-binding protein
MDAQTDLFGSGSMNLKEGPQPIVEAVNVHKYFHDNHVLRGVNLSISEREVIVICGPSGSGKSTFLRCLNHLEKIDDGRIRVCGHYVGLHGAKGRSSG